LDWFDAAGVARIELSTRIRASRERCFDLSRDIDLHLASMEDSGERAIAGRTSGLIGAGEEVTWEARHFGIRHEHCSRITAFDPPAHFRDSMVRGRFKRFEHDHFFEDGGDGVTLMRDVIEFVAPFGVLGRAVDRLFLRSYLERLIRVRNQVIQRAAENGRADTA
jgi:ligand-binding SRPBCC domain-containing protein